jgi:hypothetical protein
MLVRFIDLEYIQADGFRSLCSDAELIHNIWDRYDAEESGSKVFSSLISSLKWLVTEKPALLGVSSQMMGVEAPSHPESGLSYGLNIGGVAGMVGTAASVTVSGVIGMIGAGASLSIQMSATKLQWYALITFSPFDTETNIAIAYISWTRQIPLCYRSPMSTSSECNASPRCVKALPLYWASLHLRHHTTPTRSRRPCYSRPASPQSGYLAPDEPATRHLCIVHSMVDNGWPALLAALSFIISTSLSGELFVDVLTSYQAMTNVSGMLALTTPPKGRIPHKPREVCHPIPRSCKLGVVHRACNTLFGSITNGEPGTDFPCTTARIIGAELCLLEGVGIKCSLPCG